MCAAMIGAMAILAGLAGMLGRFAGRLLNTTLGWATTLLFGKVSQRNQTVLLLIVFGSLGWIALIVGVLVPDVGTMLIAFVPAPDFVEEGWIRLAMLAGAIALPLVVGAAAVYITEPQQRPRGRDLVVAVLRGYPFTLALALTIAVLAAVATFRRLRAMAKRWEDTHLPVIVQPGRYEEVLRRIHEELGRAGVELAVKPAPRIVSAPPKLLDVAAGHALGALVPDRLMLLVSPDLEVLVYPSDLAISGSKKKVAAARAAIVARLTYAPAWMTATVESQAIEDEVHRLGRQDTTLAEANRRIAGLDARLASLVVPFEDWESAYRQRLQLERDKLRQAGDAFEADDDEVDEGETGGQRGLAMRAALAGLIGLVAADIVLLVASRRQREGDERR